MMSASTAIVDALNRLLSIESSSLFRRIDAAGTYILRGEAMLRMNLAKIGTNSFTRAEIILEMLASLDALVHQPHAARVDLGLSFLTLDHLLPHLRDEKLRELEAYLRTLDVVRDHPHLRSIASQLEAMSEQIRTEQTLFDKAIAAPRR